MKKLIVASCTLALLGCAAQRAHWEGLRFLENGEDLQAIQKLQEAASLDPRDARYQIDWLNNRELITNRFLDRADKAMEKGDVAIAESIFKTIQQYDKGNARAKDGLALLARRKKTTELLREAKDANRAGDRNKALTLLNRVLDLMPEQAEALAFKRNFEEAESRELLASPTLSNIYKKPLTLEFRDANIKMIFDVLSKTTSINFILDKEVRADQRTSLFLKQTSLEDAVDMLVATNQLEKKVLNASTVLIYPSTPAKLKEYQDLVVKAFYLSGADVKQTASLLKTVLKLKDVFIDDKLNMLVLRESPETIALAQKLIALYDVGEPEVMLEVQVLEVTRSKLLDLGIQLPSQLTVTPLNLIANPLSDSTGTTTNNNAFRVSDLSKLNSNNLGITVPQVTLNLNKQDGDVNLLANPRIRVHDREKAKILIGDKIPVVTTTTTSTGFVSDNIQYLDVGIKLDVEANVHLQDDVTIRIGLEVSTLGQQVTTKSGALAYQIGTRSASSVLRLKDGETQVLAGLIRDDERSSGNRVPGIGELPVLGRLFSSQHDEAQKTEIILSITPHVVSNLQRKDPAAEQFWSGTESVLRTKPLQLRATGELDNRPIPEPRLIDSPSTATPAKPDNKVAPQDKPEKSTQAKPIAAPVAPIQKSVEPESAGSTELKLNWLGPASLKVGEMSNIDLQLSTTQALKGLPLQISYNPSVLEVVLVKPGDFFQRNGSKVDFVHTLDSSAGRISIAQTTATPSEKGAANLLSLRVKALKPVRDAMISLTSMAPSGTGANVTPPTLPVNYVFSVVQ